MHDYVCIHCLKNIIHMSAEYFPQKMLCPNAPPGYQLNVEKDHAHNVNCYSVHAPEGISLWNISMDDLDKWFMAVAPLNHRELTTGNYAPNRQVI